MLPVGEDGRAHPLPYTPERPLIEQVDARWARSTKVSLNGTDVPALTIQLTDGPIPDLPDAPVALRSEPLSDDERREDIRARVDEIHTVDAVSTRVDTPPSGAVPDRQTLAVPGLDDVLTQEGTLTGTRERWVPYRGSMRCPYRYRGPRFTLSGTVYFRPLQPFDPGPTLPPEHILNGSNSRTEGPLYAVEAIGGNKGFRYPDDILSAEISI